MQQFVGVCGSLSKDVKPLLHGPDALAVRRFIRIQGETVPVETWRAFTLFAFQWILPLDQELEFLALKDIPSASIRKVDIVRGMSAHMPLGWFSHWRPIVGVTSQLPFAAVVG